MSTHYHIFRSYGDRSRMLGRKGRYATKTEAQREYMKLRRQGVMIVILHQCRLGDSCEA